MRAARLEHRRQEAAFYLLRDFRAARASLHLAEEKSEAARARAVAARASARSTAEAALTAAGEAVAEAEQYASVVHLGFRERTLLEKSRLALAEATIRQRAGEHLIAADLAETATDHASQVQNEAVGLAARYTDADQIRTWRRWVAETIDWSRRTGSPAIVVNKETHRLTVYDRGQLLRSYPAELGSNTAGTKLRSGDNATPEGRYQIASKKGQGQSKYYKALLLNYPNDEDRARFARLQRSGQIPPRSSLGGLIEIHGEGGRGKDWTQGCVAVRNEQMDDLFSRVTIGTPVTIIGSDGNGGVFTDLVKRFKSQGGGAGGP
jgi:lipoprotein-anchoring transpeptidase ErfK/SrfK